MLLKQSFLGKVSLNTISHEWLRDILDGRESEDVTYLILAIDLLLSENFKKVTDCNLNVVEHGQALVILGVKLKVDVTLLTALMLYPAYVNNVLEQEKLKADFSNDIIKLLDSAKELINLEDLWSKSHNVEGMQVDVMRRFLLAMVNDVRSVVLRLVLQLCKMYHLDDIDNVDKKYIASLSKNLYAPLANRLGLSQLKWQLEDLAFRELDADEYKKISNLINEKRDVRQIKVTETINLLKNLCSDLKDINISGRVKHFYGIYKKVQKKQIDINEVYDVLATRIIVETVEDCYRVLSIVHENFEPIKQEFDDYIAVPKQNGYQSIHTAVKISYSHIVEVQIRTKKMHDFADSGGACHWLYKEGGVRDNVADKISWLNQLVSWQDDLSKNNSCFSNRVFVFTPKGEVKDLAKGATPLDFAYSIHTQVGHSCRGAKVNGRIVPLSTQLSNADRVQIITGKEICPIANWLTADPKVIQTNAARLKVEAWFRRQDKSLLLEKARFMLDKGSKISNNDLLKICKNLSYKTVDDLLLALARHEVTISSLLKNIDNSHENLVESKVESGFFENNRKNFSQYNLDVPVIVEGLSGILVSLAKCCSPINGDFIIGRVSKLKGVVVHKRGCSQVQDYAINHDRFLNVTWLESEDSKFFTNIEINIFDIEVGKKIQHWFIQNDVIWTSCNYMHKNGQAEVKMKISVIVKNQHELNVLIKGVNNLPGVLRVTRC